jgi:hypothetical protein
MHDERRIHAGLGRYRTDGRALEAVVPELRSRGGQNRRSGGVTITRSRGHAEQCIQQLLTWPAVGLIAVMTVPAIQIGLDPDVIDYSSPDFAQFAGLSREKLRAANDDNVAALRAAGLETVLGERAGQADASNGGANRPTTTPTPRPQPTPLRPR